MKAYEKCMKRKQIEELPVGTISILDAGKYSDVHIEIKKNNGWVHFYLQDGSVHTIPVIQVEDIEWKERWK